MANETKEDIAAERDQLRARNEVLEADLERMRGQLAAAGANRVATPEHTFQLSEGDRQELEIRGVINVGGRLMTTDEVRKALGKDQKNVKIKDAPPETAVDQVAVKDVTGPGRRGLDYVWPSVERGKIDPAVAGTPGISGPAAGSSANGE